MKDRIARAKEFVNRNRTILAYSVGVVAGTAVTYYIVTRHGKMTAYAMSSDGELNTLMDNRLGFLMFPGPKCNIILMSENFVKEHGHS